MHIEMTTSTSNMTSTLHATLCDVCRTEHEADELSHCGECGADFCMKCDCRCELQEQVAA